MVAEHMCILKNYQNTYYPRLSLTPETGKVFHNFFWLFLPSKLELVEIYLFSVQYISTNFQSKPH